MTAPDERLRLFLWLWMLIPVIFFSFSGSKLPGYILPIFPAAALLIALELERRGRVLRAEEFDEAASKAYDREVERWVEEWNQREWLRIGIVFLLLIAATGVGWRGAQELNASKSAAWAVAAIAAAVTAVYYCISMNSSWPPDRIWRGQSFHLRLRSGTL